MQQDLRNIEVIMSWVAYFEPEFDFKPIIEEWAKVAIKELDFCNEAENQRVIAKNMADAGIKVIIPKITQKDGKDLVTKGVLVMEFCEGFKVTDVKQLDKYGVDREALMNRICQAYAHQVYIDGKFNADPHPGNILVQVDTRSGEATPVLLDFGMVKVLDDDKRHAFARLVFSAATMDFGGLLRSFDEMGLVLKRDDPMEDMKNFRFVLRDTRPADEMRKTSRKFVEARWKKRNTLPKSQRNPVEAWPPELLFFFRVTLLLKGMCCELGARLKYMTVLAPYARMALLRSFPTSQHSKQIVLPSKQANVSEREPLQRNINQLLGELYEAGQITGAQVAVYHNGLKIVDTCAGTMGPCDPRPVQTDTLFNCFSVTKAIAATAVLVCADDKKLSLSDFVVNHWPKFAAHGKGTCTIEQVLTHSAGLHKIGTQGNETLKDLCSWERMLDIVAETAPLHPPGEDTNYHVLSFGWLVGGIVQAVTKGGHLRDFVRRSIASPLGIEDEFYLGLGITGADDFVCSTKRIATLSNGLLDIEAGSLSPEELKEMITELRNRHKNVKPAASDQREAAVKTSSPKASKVPPLSQGTAAGANAATTHTITISRPSTEQALGVRITQSVKGIFRVSKLKASGWGERSGLVRKDVIISVNGKQADGYELEEVIAMMTENATTQVALRRAEEKDTAAAAAPLTPLVHYGFDIDECIQNQIRRTCPESDEGGEWKQFKEYSGVKMWRYVSSGADVGTRGRCHIPQPVDVIMGMIKDRSIKKQWDETYNSARETEDHKEEQWVIACEAFNAIWPVSGRDFVVFQYGTILENGTGVFIAKNTTHPDFPPNKTYVRGKCIDAGFVLIPDSAGQGCTVNYISHADINGNIPTALVRKVAESQPMNVYRLRELAKRLTPAQCKAYAADAPKVRQDSVAPVDADSSCAREEVECTPKPGKPPAARASRVIHGFDLDDGIQEIVQRTHRDSDKGGRWTQFKEYRGVTMWKEESDGAGVAVRARAHIKKPVDVMMGFIADKSTKGTWDESFNSGRDVEEIETNSKIVNEKFNGIWPVAGRDFCVFMHSTRLSDGTGVAFAKNTTHTKCPEASPYVRGECVGAGFVLRPDADGEGCVVDYLSHSDLKGSIPKMILAKVGEKQPMNVYRLKQLAEKLTDAQCAAYAAEAPPIMQDTHAESANSVPGSNNSAGVDNESDAVADKATQELVDRLMPGQNDVLKSSSLLLDPCMFNTSKIRKACIPSANGHFTARALARFYAALANGGQIDGVRILSEKMVQAMQHERTACTMHAALPKMPWGLGVRKFSETAFGELLKALGATEGQRRRVVCVC